MTPRLLDPLTLLAFPASCDLCRTPLRSDHRWSLTLPHRVCRDCLRQAMDRAGAPAWRLGEVAARALLWYEGPTVAWVRGIKEGDARGLLADLAALWPQAPLALPVDCLLVPVPADPLRRRQRGGDHVRELARLWGRTWHRPVASLLRRQGGVKQQGLTAAERRRNLADQYRARPLTSGWRGRPLALIDDVCTTGSTLSLCRDLLTAEGLEVRAALTLASAPHPGLRADRLCELDLAEVHEGLGS